MIPKQSVLKLYKKRGETPLECLNRFKLANPEYKDDKMTYAGRLDPLAEGILLVLVGEECKNKDKYLGLDKEYEVTVLFGFATDSFDVLGLVNSSPVCHPRECGDPGILVRSIMSSFRIAHNWLARYCPFRNTDIFLLKNSSCSAQPASQVSGKGSISLAKLDGILKSFVGRFSQKYPPFSSKTVNGIPLFAHAKSGNLDPDEIPSKDVEIKNIELLKESSISKSEFEKSVKESIALVSGDFRQKEILKSWESALSRTVLDNFQTITIKVSCTSGTYMRSLANAIGEKVGIPALALNIKRIRIGKDRI
ncbi:MAG: hypothetical protein WC631_01385 [Candidatus Paceibacterota bacterium]|jgi:tRNA U55 pseudouridine synthase TruB